MVDPRRSPGRDGISATGSPGLPGRPALQRDRSGAGREWMRRDAHAGPRGETHHGRPRVRGAGADIVMAAAAEGLDLGWLE